MLLHWCFSFAGSLDAASKGGRGSEAEWKEFYVTPASRERGVGALVALRSLYGRTPSYVNGCSWQYEYLACLVWMYFYGTGRSRPTVTALSKPRRRFLLTNKMKTVVVDTLFRHPLRCRVCLFFRFFVFSLLSSCLPTRRRCTTHSRCSGTSCRARWPPTTLARARATDTCTTRRVFRRTWPSPRSTECSSPASRSVKKLDGHIFLFLSSVRGGGWCGGGGLPSDDLLERCV